MADYYERSHTPLDSILGMKDISDKERARLLGEGCMLVEAEVLEMLTNLDTTALEVLAAIRTARTKIEVGERTGGDVTIIVQQAVEDLHNKVFPLWYNDLDFRRFQLHASEAVDSMPEDVRARFTRLYPPKAQSEIQA